MVSHQLSGSRLLVVEDDFYLADDARFALSQVGAEVLGPVATVQEAHMLIEENPTLDGVVLDVNLRGELAFAVADSLQSRGIPFAFVTGYDRAALPERFADAVRLEKPVDPQQLIDLFISISPAREPPG